jgi:hypothetical protein
VFSLATLLSVRFCRQRRNVKRQHRNRPPLQIGSQTQPMEIRLLLSATNSPGIAPDYSTHLVLLGEAAAPLAAQNTTDRDLQHAAFLSQLDELFDESIVVRFNYTNALNGLALHLTAEQARQISELPNVAMVLQDASSRLQQNTALLTGASGVWDGSALNPGTVGTRGEGVLIGIIDSGIDFDNASFAEVGPNDGYVHINPFGDGVFRGVGDPNSPNFDPSLPLNNKVVGAWDYTSDAINASGDADHGTSVAGIAVGNYVTVPVPNSDVTTEISGVAPHANIIAYDVCTTIDDCSNSAIMAAVDQAIADGVDAINLSIGGGTEDPWDGVMASALLNAHAAGIFVAVSAGNEGPDQGTLTAPADAPWVTAVASVGISDEPTNTIRVTGENVPAHIASIIATAGEDVTIAADVGPAKVIHAADVSPGDALGTLPYKSSECLRCRCHRSDRHQQCGWSERRHGGCRQRSDSGCADFSGSRNHVAYMVAAESKRFGSPERRRDSGIDRGVQFQLSR